MNKFPSAKELLEEARKENPGADINKLHSLTFFLMKKYRDTYYQNKVNDFIKCSALEKLPPNIKFTIKNELLKPIEVEDKLYSNFMEETSRRISQTFQPISGNLAELCVEKELIDTGLKERINYKRKIEHTDLIMYYPLFQNYQKKHRIEVKNVKLRERGVRGFKFDGDSMIGFFDDPNEFTSNNLNLIDGHCINTGGYCYVPPAIFEKLGNKIKGKRFKSNTEFALDMAKFTKNGII